MQKDKAYYLRLKRKFSLTFMLIALIPLFLISWSSSRFYQNTCLQNTINSMKNAVENRNRVITFFLDHQKELLEELMRLHSYDQFKDQAEVERIFAAITPGGIVDLGVIDATGQHISYVGPYKHQLMGKNYEKEAWFHEVMVNGSYISDIFLGFRNVPHFIVAVADPLRKWVLRATINSEFFYGLIRNTQTGEKGDAFIVNRTGEFQTPSRLGGTILPKEERVLLTAGGGTDVKRIGNFVYVTSRLKNGDWLLVNKAEVRSVHDTFRQARNLDTISILIAALVIVITSVLIIRHMVNRIEESDREKAVFDSQMMQVEKMASLGIMAAGLAHEVNNPLQLITDQADWIRELLVEEDPEKVRNLEEYRKAAEKIKLHVSRASNVTHRLLGFSRKMKAEKGAVNINNLVDEVVSFVVNEAKVNDITINKHLQEDMPAIMTDAAQLQQVFLNILNNSMDAIGKNGAVDIATSFDDKHIIIEFRDNGPGIPREIMENIFDPFFTTKEPGKGTGLGLSISYHIIQTLGGKIEVRNGEDGGAVFMLLLPIIQPGARR
ncbi:MAG: ATP-binding protein [Desulfobulbaceae bacterium]|jgi:two-component system NtrC family sensor kinase|nr:ATP-binding protein [Desulfobulbaceae bacterium]